MLDIEDLEYQKKIMQFVSLGYSSKEIAASIGKEINRRVIEYQIETLKKRYMAKNLPALLAIFFRKKLIK